ncbi:fructosamine kinase family protein [Halobacillus litoralis]|uniref:fructosamine kinase family protein n=1 Tax=Halobacillus litoralis TaxID=45668 RepID=UPI001CFF3CE0|nr:fructosamine kinase family protein [Halobacillus litoralis]
MENHIRDALTKVKDSSSLKKFNSIQGGDINQAFYVETEKQSYFIKVNEGVPSHFFQVEADGLEAIRETRTIRVPDVYYYDIPRSKETAALVMEWIEPGSSDSPEKLGRQLAQLHQNCASQYGYGAKTFVGKLDQPNEWERSWVDYYRNHRLGRQLEAGITKGTINKKRRTGLEQVIEKLDHYLPADPKPSLLHGDLWGGNWMTDMQGSPVLIDPSILYGDHAFELAFTELFGGFPQSFYDAYQENFPLPDSYEETKPLYQLFYLLVHLNMFGEMYGPPVDRIINHFSD